LAQKFLSSLAGSSRKIQLRFPNAIVTEVYQSEEGLLHNLWFDEGMLSTLSALAEKIFSVINYRLIKMILPCLSIVTTPLRITMAASRDCFW